MRAVRRFLSTNKSYKLNFSHLESNITLAQQNALNRGHKEVDVFAVVELYRKLNQTIAKRQVLEAERNQIAKSRALGDRGKEIKEKLHEIKSEEESVRDELFKLAGMIPNWTHPDVPIGPEENAKLVRVVGEKKEIKEPKDHIQLGVDLGWFDFERSSVISGNKSVVVKEMGAALELALTNWVIQKLKYKGFEFMIPSDLVRNEFVARCGFLPGGEEVSTRHVYKLQDTDLSLSGTSEIGLTSMYYDTIFHSNEMPRKFMGLSHCFRPEVSSGHETRGIYRLHQFTKVEMVVLCHPDQSEEMHQHLLENEIEIFSELGLHFRVLDMPTEELGAPAYRKYDIEAWMPGKNAFGEVRTKIIYYLERSPFSRFQARRIVQIFRAED
jgi:seryl-tRNA synthetase